MKRLTERNQNGDAYYPYCFQEDTCEGMGTSEKCDRCDFSRRICEKLAYYEDLEEQGRMLKLPCKVGDTLYLPIDITHEIVVGTCTGFTEDRHRNRGMLVEITYKRFEKCWEAFSDFGKTVFLTQAEAENALKRMESEE